MNKLTILSAISAALILGLSKEALAQTHADKTGTPVAGVVAIPALVNNAYGAATVGTSDQTIVTANSAFYLLEVINNSSTATICLSLGATATISGSVCAAAEIALPPLWHRSWDNVIPTDAVHAIASAASTPATVGVK